MSSSLDSYVAAKQKEALSASEEYFNLAVRLARGEKPKKQTIDKVLADASETVEALAKLVEDLSQIRELTIQASGYSQIYAERERANLERRQNQIRRDEELKQFQQKQEEEARSDRFRCLGLEQKCRECGAATAKRLHIGKRVILSAELEQLAELRTQREKIWQNRDASGWTIALQRQVEQQMTDLASKIDEIEQSCKQRVADLGVELTKEKA